MSKIKNIYVGNMRSITESELNLNGCTAIITGGNNKGKSTIAKALIERLRGIKNELIVRQGEKEGYYEMELTTGEKLIWNIKEDGKEKLTFITERNIKSSLTKDIARHYFPPVFDVDEFLNETPSKQRAILEKISGLDFTDVDRQYNAAYEERTWANKKLEEAKVKYIKFEPEWVDEVRSTEELENELNGIEAHNLTYVGIKEKLNEKKIKKISNNESIDEIKEQIVRLQNSIIKIETENSKLAEEIFKGEIWIEEEKNKPKPPALAIQLKEKIEDIKKNNEAVRLGKEFEKAELNAKEANDEVKKIISDKEEMIRLADLPEGFGFNNEGITYCNLPFNKKNLSSSSIYIAALKLAVRGLGEVRAIHFDASFLDKNSLEQIMNWAESNNLQLLIERPDFEGGEITYQIIEKSEE